MDAMLRRALRQYTGLRHHVDQALLGDDDGTWEKELKKFLRREPCWASGVKPNLRFDKRREGWTLLEHQPCRIVTVAGLELVPFLRDGEQSIGGFDLIGRARYELGANLGQEDAEWLLEHQEEIPAEFRQFYFVFTATVWRAPDGNLDVSCLCCDGVQWDLGWPWLEDEYDSDDHLLRPGK